MVVKDLRALCIFNTTENQTTTAAGERHLLALVSNMYSSIGYYILAYLALLVLANKKSGLFNLCDNEIDSLSSIRRHF